MQGETRKIDQYQYSRNNFLGRGRFGDVYKGKDTKNMKQVSLKFVKKKNLNCDDYEKAALFSELKFRASIKSKNLVEACDIFDLENSYCIIRPFCQGDLGKIIKNKGVPQQEAKEILRQIVNGLMGLVKQGIIHGCLRPSAILFQKTSDHTIYKVGDYIVDGRVFSSKVQEIASQSKKYLSIQKLKGEHSTSKCDIWSLGCIYYELLHGEKIFDIENEYQIIQTIEKKNFKHYKKNISEESKDFLKKCLQPNADSRINWEDLFAHQIFSGFFIKEKPCFFNLTKKLMGEIRFQVNIKNLNIFKILFEMGYKGEENQLSLEAFTQFLKTLNSKITDFEAKYIFEKVSKNQKTVSISQIKELMQNNQIFLQSVFSHIPKFSSKYIISRQLLQKIIRQSQEKVKKIFIILRKQILQRKTSLREIFRTFSKTFKGRLLKCQFRSLMKSINSSIEENELDGIFSLIDQDNSKTIEFDELNKYYSRINGVPQEQDNQEEEIQEIQSDFEEEEHLLKELINPKMYGYSGFKKTDISFSGWTEQFSELNRH